MTEEQWVAEAMFSRPEMSDHTRNKLALLLNPPSEAKLLRFEGRTPGRADGEFPDGLDNVPAAG